MTGTYTTYETEAPQLSARQTDGFSWRRVAMLYSYYMCIIKRQCVIYLTISLICAGLLLLPGSSLMQTSLFSLIWTMVPFLFLCAPCVLGSHCQSPIIDKLIPASVAEKMTFFITYFFIVILAITYGPLWCARWLYMHLPAIQTEPMMVLYQLSVDTPVSVGAVNWLIYVNCVLACLLAVKAAKTSRILKGILAVLAVNFLGAVFGAIAGFSSAFNVGYNDAASGKEISRESLNLIMQQMNESTGFLVSAYTLYSLLLITLLILIWRVLENKNL